MRPQRRRSFVTGPELDIDRGGVLTLTMPPQGCGVPATIVVCCSGSGHPGRPSPRPKSSTTTASPARSVRPPADTVTAGENRTVTVLGSRISTGALVWPGSPAVNRGGRLGEDAGMTPPDRGLLHHVELWVPDLTSAPAGLNHLAFYAGDRDSVDALAAAAPEHGWVPLFADRYPHAGGPEHYAAYLEDQDGYEVELIAG